MRDIFYQSSLPRAGSTLLQNIIGQNPDFYVTPTSGVLDLVYGARNNFEDCPEFKAQDKELMDEAFRHFCFDGVKGYFNYLTDKPYIVDKSRGWGYYYDFLSFFQTDPKIICMVRDLRGIYSSMEKIFRKAQALSRGPIIDMEMVGTTTAKRVDLWAKAQPVGLAIERLEQIILEGNDKYMLFIRYEDLIHNPDEQMQRIYEYFNVPFYKHDFDNIEQITIEDDTIYGTYGDHKIQPKLIKPPADYNDILGEEVSKSICKAYNWFYHYFNYN